MRTLTLRYFVVKMKKEDAFDQYDFPQPLHPIFNALCRHCKENGYGETFSMDEITGFVIHTGLQTKSVFRVVIVKANGANIGSNPGPGDIREYLKYNDILEIYVVEDLKAIIS